MDKAKEEADFAVRLANEYKEHIKFIVLDIEEDTERYARQCGANPNWTECCIAFMERIKSSGYIPVLYINQNWMNSKLDYDRLKNYKLWLAAPDVSESVPKKYSNMVLWQCSWTGKIDGINGNVDLDFCYDNTLFSKNADTKTADKKSVDILAQEVINGKWGNGDDRKKRLTTAGYDYNAVQNKVNGLLSRKTVEQLAEEVIMGKWGNGSEREKKLTAAGYDYNAVQAKVNQMLR